MARRWDSSPQTLLVFEALLGQPGRWRHGYDLGKQTGLASGTLYPILMRLAERGLLSSRWEEPERPGRPPRHAYRLTTDGAELARSRLAEADAAGRRPHPAPRPGPAVAHGA